MVSVNNIITDIERGEIGNLISFFSSVKRLSLALFLVAEYLSASYYRNPNQRIFKAPAY